VHLALLAPSQVRLLGVNELPALDARTAVVLFPDDEAVAAEEVDVSSVTDVIVVDSKWGQARGVVASDKLRGLRHVRIGAYVTSYWRHDRADAGYPTRPRLDLTAACARAQVSHRWCAAGWPVHC
jgi:hypothetical protein